MLRQTTWLRQWLVHCQTTGHTAVYVFPLETQSSNPETNSQAEVDQSFRIIAGCATLNELAPAFGLHNDSA